jgi:hypothetical protein
MAVKFRLKTHLTKTGWSNTMTADYNLASLEIA